jgi:hypothetical protein
MHSISNVVKNREDSCRFVFDHLKTRLQREFFSSRIKPHCRRTRPGPNEFPPFRTQAARFEGRDR